MDTVPIPSINTPSASIDARITGIQYGIWTREQIKCESVVDVTNSHMYDKDNPNPNGLFDLRMGTVDKKRACETCNKTILVCPGHWGRMPLPMPCFHALFIDQLTRVLYCICFHCSRILIGPDDERVQLIQRQCSGAERSREMAKLCRQQRSCRFEHESFSSVPNELERYGCGRQVTQIKFENELVLRVKQIPIINTSPDGQTILSGASAKTRKQKNLDEIPIANNNDVIYPERVFEILHRMPKFQYALLGIDSVEHLIQYEIPVPPPNVRPPVVTERGTRGDDDITRRLQDILRACSSIRRAITIATAISTNAVANASHAQQSSDIQLGNKRPRDALGDSSSLLPIRKKPVTGVVVPWFLESVDYEFKHWYLLQVNVSSYYMGDKVIVKEKDFPKRSTRQRRLKSLSDRIKGGKESRVRNTMMGKRSDFTGRAVITPDPNIAMDEIGIPLSTAITLTEPIVVNQYNYREMQKYVRNGPYKYPGARFIQKRNHTNGGNTAAAVLNQPPSIDDKIDLRIASQKPSMRELEYGDTVDRHLIIGDSIAVNRQPSLHRMSMMSHRVVVMDKGNTYRLNPCVCGPYNADFDGDEMNTHVCQDMHARVELDQLMRVSQMIVSDQASKTVVKLAQDAVLGCWMISHEHVLFTHQDFCQMCMESQLDSVFIERVINRGLMKSTYSGRDLLVLNLPETFFIKTTEIHIEKGRWVRGLFTSAIAQTIVHYYWLDYDKDQCAVAINRFQLIAIAYLYRVGFSVGYDDALSIGGDQINKILNDGCDRVVNTCREQQQAVIAQHQQQMQSHQKTSDDVELLQTMANQLYQTHLHEQRAMVADTALEISEIMKDKVSLTNRFRMMIDAGSRGSILNLQHIVAFMSQMDVNGRPVQRFVDGTRTLPHFDAYHTDPRASGFFTTNYSRGVNAAQFFLACMAGREGLIDTAVKTANTGYVQRRLIKAMEELLVAYDNTIRDASGAIVQFAYGDDDFSGQYLERYGLHMISHTDQQWKQSKKYDEYTQWLWYSIVRPTIVDRKDKRVSLPFHIYRIIDQYQNDTTPPPIRSNTTLTTMSPDRIEVFLKKFVRPTLPLLHEFVIRVCMIDFYEKWNERIEYEILRRWKQALVQPGDMNGVIAAHSAGEPATQMTLNTFHYAGVSSKNVTLGIPRLTELIDMTKHIKTPSVTVRFNEQTLNHVLQYSIQQTTVYEYIDSKNILFTDENSYMHHPAFTWTDHGEPYQMERYCRFGLCVRLQCKRFMETHLNVFDWKAHIEYAVRKYYAKTITLTKITYPLVCFGGVFDDGVMYIRLANVLFPDMLQQQEQKQSSNNIRQRQHQKSGTNEIEEQSKDEDSEEEVEDENADEEDDTLEDNEFVSEHPPTDLIDLDGEEDLDEATDEEDEEDKVGNENLHQEEIDDDDEPIEDDEQNETTADQEEEEEEQVPVAIPTPSKKSRSTHQEDSQHSLIVPPDMSETIDQTIMVVYDDFIRSVLQCTIVSGVRGVHKTHVVRVPESDDWTLETEGENTLLDIMAIHGVDGSRCVSNDVIEIQSVLGLEAACRVLLDEIRNVLSFDGCYVNDRHIKLLVDKMSYSGTLKPVTRHGVNRDDPSTLKKCTFEETLDIMVNAGVYGAYDRMEGVTENLMMGQTGRLGTSVCETQLDTKMLMSVDASKTSLKRSLLFSNILCRT